MARAWSTSAGLSGVAAFSRQAQPPALLLAFQAEGTQILAAAGYSYLQAQVTAGLAAEKPFFTVTARNPRTNEYSALSYGMGPTPAKALEDFFTRLEPAQVLEAA